MLVYKNYENLLEGRFSIEIRQTRKGYKIKTEDFAIDGGIKTAVYYIEFTEEYHKNKKWNECDGFHAEWQRLLTDIQCGKIVPYKKKIS